MQDAVKIPFQAHIWLEIRFIDVSIDFVVVVDGCPGTQLHHIQFRLFDGYNSMNPNGIRTEEFDVG